MIDNFLKKFCSDEVKILLTHMDEHFEDFNIWRGVKAWKDLLEKGMKENGYATRAEKVLINRMWRKKNKEARRKTFLANIVKQKIAPENEEAIETQNAYSQHLSQLLAAQQAQQAQQSQLLRTQQGYLQGLGHVTTTNKTTP